MYIEEGNIEDLLIAYLKNELDEGRSVEVEQWIHTSKENEKVFLQTVQIWESAQPRIADSFDSEKAWNKVESQMKRKPVFSVWQKVAAAVVLVAAAYIAFWNYTKPEVHQIASFDQPLIDTLSDGSVITLNANSSLRYTAEFNSERREVDLAGEAYFNIKRDSTKKFIVNLQDSRVTVLGTSFNINSSSSSDNITVFVNSGTVLFEYRSTDSAERFQSTKLHAGDKISYNKVTHNLNTSRDPNHMDLYWLNKNLVFDSTSLDEVGEMLESVYKVDISFSDSTSKDCMLTASFHDADIGEVIAVIASTFEFKVQKDQNKYLFIGDGCENN